MYLAHFGLTERPFGITPDTSFIYSATAHQEALNTLLIGLASGEGFIKITGEVGTGKTLLCRRFLATLGEEYFSVYLPNPSLQPLPLLLAVAEELGLKLDPDESQFQLIKHINEQLLALSRTGKTVVCCVDEAQAAPLASLEALRLLSNLETEKHKLIHVVLFGQPELNQNLADPSVRQLQQRIAFHYHLPGLQPAEFEHYLDHRLKIAGHCGPPLFSRQAAQRLYRYSQGTPRLVNILANKALLAAYGEGKARVEVAHVVAAARDTAGLEAGRRRFFKRWLG
ncbi:MAG: AAA family ATPase [Sterolibacterium sp.]|nr:AAA family ATPase [Sterolibacterium sp.]